jgi:hypothetical protein
MGLGVQFGETVLYRPDQGVVQGSKINASVVEAQIERFRKEDKPSRGQSDSLRRAEIAGLQVRKDPSPNDTDEVLSASTASSPDADEVVPQTVPKPNIETASGLGFIVKDASPEEVSERNSSSLILLCVIGGGLVLTLMYQYYKGSFVF